MDIKQHLSPLRLVLIVIGCLMLIGAIALWSEGNRDGGALVLLFYGLILFLSLLFEHSRYMPKIDRGQRGWEPTDEKFIDPVTGEPVQVWFNPRSGERDYRPIQR